jgi:hypothetical protein
MGKDRTKQFNCDKCDTVCSYRSALLRHITQKHKNDTPNLYCPKIKCTYNTKRVDVLMRHVAKCDRVDSDSESNITEATEDISIDHSTDGIEDISECESEVQITDIQALYKGDTPPGSEETYPKVILGTLNTSEVCSILHNISLPVTTAQPSHNMMHLKSQRGERANLTIHPQDSSSSSIPMMTTSTSMSTTQVNGTPQHGASHPNMSQQMTGPDTIELSTPSTSTAMPPPGGTPSSIQNTWNISVEDGNTIATKLMESLNANKINPQMDTPTPQAPKAPHVLTAGKYINVNSKPIVRVSVLEFDYQPTPGEIFQVNDKGNLMKIRFTPGTLFQADYEGMLQELYTPVSLTNPQWAQHTAQN